MCKKPVLKEREQTKEHILEREGHPVDILESTIDNLKATTLTKDVERCSNEEVEFEEKVSCEGLAVIGLQLDKDKAINNKTPIERAEPKNLATSFKKGKYIDTKEKGKHTGTCKDPEKVKTYPN